jgi:hypothetical protein
MIFHTFIIARRCRQKQGFLCRRGKFIVSGASAAISRIIARPKNNKKFFEKP